MKIKMIKTDGNHNRNFHRDKDEKFFDLWMKPFIVAGLWAISRRLGRTMLPGEKLPTRLQLLQDACNKELTIKKDGYFVKYFVGQFIFIITMFAHKDPAYQHRFFRILRRYLKEMEKARLKP